MTLRAPTITAYFDLTATGGSFFTLNHATRGELDAVSYPLGGDLPTDITAHGYDITINRGRQGALDEFYTGTCSAQLRNQSRLYDPVLATFEQQLSTEEGVGITTEDGQSLVGDVPVAYHGNIVPGKRVTVSSVGVPLFDGNIDDWNHQWEPGGYANASLFAIDALGMLARKELSAGTMTASQLPGARISAVLNRSEISFPYNRSIGTGVSTLQADVVSDGDNALNYVQTVAQSDLGRLYADRTNVLTFRDRHSLLNSSTLASNLFTLNDTTKGELDASSMLAEPTLRPITSAAFADDGTGIAFSGIEMTYGSEELWNRVSVTRTGGTIQTSSDATSQSSYGLRSLSLTGLLVDSDVQSGDIADYLLSRYKYPVARVSAVEVIADGLADDEVAQVLALDINDIVTVDWTPTGSGSAVSQTLVVEGVEHRISASQPHVVRLSLGAVDTTTYFVLNDSVLGVLDDAALSF